MSEKRRHARCRGRLGLPGKRHALAHRDGEVQRELSHWCAHMDHMAKAALSSRGPLPGKNPALASWLKRELDLPDHLPGSVRHFRSLGDACAQLPCELMSVPGLLGPGLALRLQQKTGAEMALEYIYDRRSRRFFPLVTRGIPCGAFSDLTIYLAACPRYVVLPCFHTHPSPWNELGFEMPSKADYHALAHLRRHLRGAWVCDRVFYPSGRQTLYGIDRRGCCFYCRQGQRLAYLDCVDWLPKRHRPRSQVLINPPAGA